MCTTSSNFISTGKHGHGLPLLSIPKNVGDAIFNPGADLYNKYRGSINHLFDPPPLPPPLEPLILQQSATAAAPLPPAPDYTSEPLLNARKRARSLLSAAGGAAGDTSLASTGTSYAKATLGS